MTTKIKLRASRKRLVWGSILTVSVIILVLITTINTYSRIYGWTQTLLGEMYEDGSGVPQDDAQAVQWYRKAADQGYAKGQFKLGWIYDQGRGVPQDRRSGGAVVP